ncbi:hypothetical protein Tsubulata_033193 [Turnera subulata]|uniref:holo-[acyl-carrier-protein] synthase n=1 Tax=Turnera subulata TaxID=218843 RepID=A0A9Q0FGF4_9ROSI|nr:hypothetical protein Tsubulata_033193 [Turnera subulata]
MLVPFSFRAVTNSTWKMCCFQTNLSALSRSLATLQLPSPMETHLWYVMPDEVKSVSLLNQYMGLLSPSEKQQVLSTSDRRLQKSALLARTLVRTIIARYQINHHDDPRTLKFKKNIHGKPEVDWELGGCDGWCPPPLHFNISHTSSLIACGVTMNSPIGVDVEEKHRKLKHNILAFVRRYFSACEAERLSAISDTEIQRQEFVKLWTLKEAYVKALGRGFSAAPFRTFTIDIKNVKESFDLEKNSEAPEIIVKSLDDPENCTTHWRFALLELAGSHYTAICIEKDKASEVGMSIPIRMTVRKTIPLVCDECVSGTDAVLPIAGSIKQFL